ncbi:ABC transporter substrate-binding protein [Nonomuraea typhae]|uniref:ABC transporter substrate-binding protein n=1 Tax=Nonomuraea typhae TaxID=2603600 RepID=UPI0012FB4DB8|nr:extracellular solute-binding protein [Nonomuraea typhae]
MHSTRRAMALFLVAGLAGPAACGTTTPSATTEGKVTIKVACQPAKSDPRNRKVWDDDVAAFQKLHPDVTVVSTDQQPCFDPKTFGPKLAGGQMETVFRVPVTNTQDVIAKGQARDITGLTGEIKNFGDFSPATMTPYSAGGKIYGIPTSTYSVGLVYNRTLFQRAGLDPDTPPKTWAEVREAAKKIAALGPGHVGYGEYSGGNTGGWHFNQAIYGRGGEMVTADGKQAAFNSPEGKAVLQFLKDLRWSDNSMGTKLLVGWESLMQAMGSGKTGMMLGAPDVVPDLVNKFSGQFADYGIGPFPEGKASLSGGEGFMINPKATPEEAKAGLQWIDFYWTTPGRGVFDYERAKTIGNPVGLPNNTLFGDSPSGKKITELQKQFATLPVANFQPFTDGSAAIPAKLEPPKAQELYAILDVAMSAVLSRRDADIDKLLADAASKANTILAKN